MENTDNTQVEKKKRGRPPKDEAQLEAAPIEENANISDVRYSDEDLEMFLGIIQKAKNEATDEVKMLRDRIEDLQNADSADETNVYSMHMAEQGSEAQEKEKAYAQIQRLNEFVKKLDDALKRVADKSYGICRICGCLIAKERLIAVPVTTLSASYKIRNKCPEDGIDKIEKRK
jgi:RNA polymerase-binding transcription factor DksA